MTPADITGNADFTIYKGAKWEHTLTFTETATGDPLDLTDLDTFVITLSNPNSNTVLANGTVVNTNLAGGIITVSFTAAQTLALALGSVRIGLRDALNNAYIVGIVAVKPFSPTPA